MAQPTSSDNPYVFLSYASIDREQALRIADLLESHGVAVWIDRKNIVGGTSWSAEIVRGIRGCSAFLIACSAAAMDSPNVQQEIQVAFESRHPILPLLLEPTDMPASVVYALAGRQWVEVLDQPEERWLPALLRSLAGLGVLVPAGVSSPLRPSPSADKEGKLPSPGHAPHAAMTEADPPLQSQLERGTGGEIRSPDTRSQTPDIPSHNLPVEVTSFVGRERELQQVQDLLARTHLLTLTGTGGCGKTRLALKLGASVLAFYSDGVWFVELAPISDSSLIPQTVARVLGVSEVVGRDLTSVLVDALRPRTLLLIVDNCEHLIADCARLVETLLRGCPNVRVVTTSRELLGASGETVWRIPSLAAPDPRQLPGDAEDRLSVVAQSDSVRLFVERAHQVVPDFEATTSNAMALAQVCYRLDGIPLAIELAASRLRALSLDQLAARLDSRFRLLTGGSRTALRRQQTLRALVDWSYDLLTPEEQSLFRKLAVFVGGWTIEAAARVCGGDGDDVEVLDLLTMLADKSLVLVESKLGEQPRYRLLETLREYAMERLASSADGEPAHAAHASYYVALARQLMAQRLAGATAVRGGFSDEIDNFRAALRWTADSERWADCLALIGSLSTYWGFASYPDECVPWIGLALEHRDELAPAARLRLLSGLGRLAYGRGDLATSEAIGIESMELSRDLGDNFEMSLAKFHLGNVLRELGRYEEAQAHLEDGVQIAKGVGDQRLVGMCLFQLGLLARQQGDLLRAKTLLTEGRQLSWRDIPTADRGGAWDLNLGLVFEDQGDLASAANLYAESLDRFQTVGDRWHLPYALEAFTTLAVRQQQPARALVPAGAASAARERYGYPIAPTMKPRLEGALATARAALGDAAAAAFARGQAMSLEQAIAFARAQSAL